MLKAISRGLMNVLRVVTLLLIVVQLTLSLIEALPETPILNVLNPLLDVTIRRYFPQNWFFFAPNPTDTNYILLVRPLTDKEAEIDQTQTLPSDGWYDLSSPVWAKLQSNRFAAYVRFANAITNATTASDDKQPDKVAVKLLIKFASAFCKDIGKSNVTYVALMVREQHSIPWPDGGEADQPAIKTNFLGIYPIDRNVENIHLYQL